jgi:hypothetical protein
VPLRDLPPRTHAVAIRIMPVLWYYEYCYIDKISLERPAPATTKDRSRAREPRWRQLGQAYGFVLCQQQALEAVERAFPDLEGSVQQVRAAFSASPFGEGAKTVEAELSGIIGYDARTSGAEFVSQTDAVFAKQTLSREQATVCLAEVRARSGGDIPEPIRSTLLSANPRYLQHPVLELTEGWRRPYRTKGNARAKGVDVSLSVPASWRARERRGAAISFMGSRAERDMASSGSSSR